MPEEKLKFVTVELSKKQVNMSHLYHSQTTDKDYARIMAPQNGIFFYPTESIKVKKDNPERVYFTRPEGTEIEVHYSRRKEDVPDSAPNDEKYEHYTRTWKIEDLKAAYDEQKKEYADNHGFYNYTVPTSWGKTFSSGGKDYISISVPVPVEDSDQDKWCSLVIGADRFKKSERDEGMSYFGFPKKKLDECIENAVKRSQTKALFVSTEISEKLLRKFESKEGKPLYAVSVPVYEWAGEQATFYEIVVPAERVSINPDTGRARLSLFKNGPDGNVYNHSAIRSIDNGNGGYDTVSKSFSSEEIVNLFEDSKKRYREIHSDADRSLADETAENTNVNENMEQAAASRRHLRR